MAELSPNDVEALLETSEKNTVSSFFLAFSVTYHAIV